MSDSERIWPKEKREAYYKHRGDGLSLLIFSIACTVAGLLIALCFL